MKVCLVSTFPPSKGGLNEYGFHLAAQLREDPTIELTILSDVLPSDIDQKELEGYDVNRCWKFNSYNSSMKVLKEINRIKPDVVWFNLIFTTFGDKRIPAFLGLLTPMLSRIRGHFSVVTLHNLIEFVDLDDAGFNNSWLNKFAGYIATRLLLFSKTTFVLLSKYKNLLTNKYKTQNVVQSLHGIFETDLKEPSFDKNYKKILLFGKFGSYKRLDFMMEAFEELLKFDPEIQLVIAGGNHPSCPHYVESIKEKYSYIPNVTFTGYLSEEEIEGVFNSSTLLALPYTSNTGTSGVAHLGCSYGLPIITSDLPDFRSLAEEEDMAIRTFPVGDKDAFVEELKEVLENKDIQKEMGLINYKSAQKMTMDKVVDSYVRFFSVQHYTSVFGVSNFIRMSPIWMPLRSKIYSFVIRNARKEVEL